VIPTRFFATAIIMIAMSVSTSVDADTAIHNITGYTSSDHGIIEFAVLIFDDNGRVVATGNDSLLEAHPDALRVNGGGKTVLPGLVDAHAHVAGLGFLKTSLDLAASRVSMMPLRVLPPMPKRNRTPGG